MLELAGADALAFYNRSNKVVYIKGKTNYDLLDYYLLAHEIRHAFQDKTDPDYYFGHYTKGMTQHEYDLSIAEIDANAFACIAIASIFGKITKRTYKKDAEAERIYNQRLNELKKEYGIEF